MLAFNLLISIISVNRNKQYSRPLDTANMKFSIIATAFLVQGIAAMPWSSVKGSRAKSDEITQVSPKQVPLHLYYHTMHGKCSVC